MKSAKVVNKILLISLAFGSVTFVAGMFVKGNLQKALLGLGGTTSVASVAGILGTSGNKESDKNEEYQSDDRVAELDSQENFLHQSVVEDTDRMQAFSTEQNQLWGEPIPDPHLNSEQQKLETENDLEVHNNYLNSKFKELTTENEILEQVVSPIEEKSFQATSFESDPFQDEVVTPQNSIEELDEPTENLVADLNPFANLADSTDAEDLSEPNQSEEISALEMADKLLGSFEPSGLDEREDTDPENSDELFMEDSDLEEEPIEALGFDDESEISSEYDEIPAYDSDESSSELEELAMEYEASSEEMSFEDPSMIATELESNDEFGLNDEPVIISEYESEAEAVDFEAMSMDEADPDESMDAWGMESEESDPEEMSFEEPSAIASEVESNEEFGFDEPSEMSFATEESDSEEINFESIPMAEADPDESIDSWEMEREESDSEEMSFEESSVIASELESSEEFAFDDQSSEMSFAIEESDSEEMSFEEPSAIASELES
ncbi:MAG: hypothetical protein RLZZ04_4421, partial [Cyanobacteriota bacterium]